MELLGELLGVVVVGFSRNFQLMKSTAPMTPTNTTPAMANTGITRFWMSWADGPARDERGEGLAAVLERARR